MIASREATGHSSKVVVTGKRKRKHDVGHDIRGPHSKKGRQGHKTMGEAMDTTNDSTDNQHAHGQQIARLIPGVDGNLIFGFPQNIITKVRYCMQAVNTHTSSVTAETQQMKMNSCFDPDSTGAGHQPWYFDEYAALYTNYRVLGSQLRVDFSPTSADTTVGTGPWSVGIVGSAVSTNPSTTATDRIEMNDSISQLINRDDGVVSLFWNYDAMEKLGQQANDDTVGALVTSDPSQVYYANVWTAPFVAAAAGNAVYYKIVVEYTVEFFKLKKGVAS